ncbi:Non-legume hemoglobin [Dissostichus eleginoides]|uniref:Non-legume hemoglobin n=1 Tax=Dissostichus eleginoides TaxID=100907 RepID=A0AAD9CGJ4_DISEL|nr:Non-legume hemoglobin [Dissostichus eleginoides]
MYVHQLLGWSRNLSCWDVYLFLEVIPLRTGGRNLISPLSISPLPVEQDALFKPNRSGRMKPVLRIEFNVWCLCLGTGNHCTVVEQIKKSEAEEESVLQHPSPVFGKQPWNHVAFIVGSIIGNKAEK